VITKFKEINPNVQKEIPKGLRRYFDEITFFNKDKWLMKYEYGNHYFFESFEISDLEEDKEFERHKLFLFLNGVYLYYVHDIERIELISDNSDENRRYYVENED